MLNTRLSLEAGEFLLSRIKKLKPNQVVDIFKLARAEESDRSLGATSQQWAEVFWAKVAEFEGKLSRCPRLVVP